ncbi:unnamed protein product [Aspergillus oryzae var. brunneus]|uniref:Arginyl-tRNA synthetase n=1 Tax=Aspergillus oryzae var. brunneus TaxID=332754 RepID=A0ABQ6KJH6_ASPOZ|nr:unnamed protein product [Aspergillus oryzae]GMG44966.1 unnamed protein product [Aspergillus oryzae var. brunneus]
MKTKKPKDIASLIYENASYHSIPIPHTTYYQDPTNKTPSSQPPPSSKTIQRRNPHPIYLPPLTSYLNSRKRIIIEFGSPNTAKSFHAGHLRSTILGGFLANLYEEAGWDVTRMNYLGDWGKQYSVLGVGVEKFGDLDVLERDPIAQLFDVYVRVSAVGRKEQESIESMRKVIASRKSQGHPLEDMERELELLQANSMDERARKYFKRMCEGDEEALGLWKKFRDLSIIKYQASFARLNIHYDVYAGESQIKNESMKEVENMTKEKRVSEVSDGAVLVDLTKYSKKLSKAIVRKKDGTSNYMTRDIGAVFERDEEYHYDNMIYVIASQQDLHMAQLIKIIELIGREGLADKLEHVNFGLVHEMSTRRGTVKFLDDILRDAKDKMQEVMRSNQAKYEQVEDSEKIADILDISAVLVQDMASKRSVQLPFADVQVLTIPVMTIRSTWIG